MLALTVYSVNIVFLILFTWLSLRTGVHDVATEKRYNGTAVLFEFVI